jgi:imidazoleglycerol phosphate dehydratase HisB
MNKQVELLAVKAGFNIHNDVIDGQNFNHEIQKFAELIVLECAQIANDHNSEVEGVTLGVGRALKQNFGVEE